MGGHDPIHDWLDAKLSGKKGALKKYLENQAAESREKSRIRGGRSRSRSRSYISDDEEEDCHGHPPSGGYGRVGMSGTSHGGLGGQPGMGNRGMAGVGFGGPMDVYGSNRMAALAALGAPVQGGRAPGGIVVPSMPADAYDRVATGNNLAGPGGRGNFQYNAPVWDPNAVGQNQPPQIVPLGPPRMMQNQPPPPPPLNNQPQTSQGGRSQVFSQAPAPHRLNSVFPPRGENQQNNGRQVRFASSPPPYNSQDPSRNRSRPAIRNQISSPAPRMQGQSRPPQQNQQAYENNSVSFRPPQEQSNRSSSRSRPQTPQPSQTRPGPVHAQTAPVILGQPGRTYIEGFATQPEEERGRRIGR